MALLVIAGVCNSPSVDLRDQEWLRHWLPLLAQDIGMHSVGEVIIEPYAHWPDGAPSAVLFLEESAISVHCYPEKNFIEVVLHSCKPISLPSLVSITIIQKLGLDVRYFQHLSELNWERLVSDEPFEPEFWPDEVRVHTVGGRGYETDISLAGA